MGIRVGLATCMVVISCLVHTAVSEHKKKIIVKVPHIIKHIHHDHYKPVHIHKPVHNKKFEHHYNTHEGGIKHGGGWKENLDHHGWKQSFSKQDQKIGKKGRSKPYARFSKVKPISIHHDNEEHIDYIDSDGKESEFNHMGLSHNLETIHRQKVGYKLGLGQRLEYEDDLGITGLRHNFDHYHESRYNFGSNVRKSKRNKEYTDGIFRNTSNFRRPKPIEFAGWVNSEASSNDYNEEDLNISDKGRDYPNRASQFYNNQGLVGSRQRKKKSNQLIWRSKEVSRKPEDEGWKPMVSVNKWKDEGDLDHNKGKNNAEQFINSGEKYSGRMHKDIYSQPYSLYSEENANTNKRYKKKKKQKWSKQIKIVDLSEESKNPKLLQHLDNQHSLHEEFSYPNVPQVQTQIIKPLQFDSHQNFNQQIQKDSSAFGAVPYQEKGVDYDNQLITHNHRKLPLQQQNHWTTQSLNQDQQQPIDQLQQQKPIAFQQPQLNNHHDLQQHQEIPVQPVWPQTTEQQQPNHNQQQWTAFEQPNLNHHHDQQHQPPPPVKSTWPQNEQPQNHHLQQFTTVQQPKWNNQHDNQQNYQHQLHQPAEPVWLQTQPTPIVQPTQPSKMMWSGHHIQLPQHSMWYVQQHAVGEAPPMQVISVNQDPQHSQSLQVPQSILPLRQELHQDSLQHKALPPGWPLDHDRNVQNGHAPMQQWEQHVHTSGSDGPASSYKVEVINYMDQKGNRQ